MFEYHSVLYMLAYVCSLCDMYGRDEYRTILSIVIALRPMLFVLQPIGTGLGSHCTAHSENAAEMRAGGAADE